MRLEAVLALALAAPAAAGVENIHEWYGARFCEISYKTSSPCPTRIALTDGDSECQLRPPGIEPVEDHRMIAPLASRELAYSILLPDGSRTEPRKLRRATDGKPVVKVWQETAEAGGVDLLASSDAEAVWSLAVGHQWEQQRLDAGTGRSLSARFHLPRVGGAEDFVDIATVTARMLDGTQTVEAGPVYGDKRLAPMFVEAANRIGIESLTLMAGAKDTTESTLRKAWEERSAAAGLAKVAEPAARRAIAVLTSSELDATATRVPFSHYLNRLRAIDWVAHLRGWKPVTGIEPAAQSAIEVTQSTEPGPAAHELFAVNPKKPVGLFLWPGNIGGGVSACSYAKLIDPKQFEELASTLLADTDPISLAMIGAGKYQLALWNQFDVEPSWLAAPLVTFYVQVANLDPAFQLNVRINDSVMLPARVDPAAYKGILVFGQAGDDLTKTLPLYGSWVAIRTSSKFFLPGKNSFVITAENLRPGKAAPVGLLISALRLGPG